MKLNIFTYFIFCFYLVSCLEVDCDKLKEVYLNEECLLIVEKTPEQSSWFSAKGRNPITNKSCECKSINRWWSLYSSEIKIGDTIIKRKGELTFNIHKKDTVITHDFKCEGTIGKP
ncbi:hypothetical protein [Riemerella columbina]|uniref:hypothetical protein n=1 Tax=Riemerella columbina TaxID=103810 RepID=UPI00037DCC31|nr:hypothetical protein [Riemerella columbina]